MGNPSHTIPEASEEIDRGNEGLIDHEIKPSSRTLQERVLEAKCRSRSSQLVDRETKATRSKNGGHLIRSKRSRSIILMKRSRASSLEGNNKGRGRCGIKSRIKILKKLVPNTESMELDVLFRETADYIVSLEMRVRVMQNMVELLTSSN